MNTDNILENQKIREQIFQDKINSRVVKCKDVEKYADKQNTVYDKKHNKMLYGLNNKMGAFGVSDGTCNQLDQLLVLNDHKCGAGAAGANPCLLERFDNNNSYNLKVTDNVIIIILFCILLVIIFNKRSL
jgi:hypothetical protein